MLSENRDQATIYQPLPENLLRDVTRFDESGRISDTAAMSTIETYLANAAAERAAADATNLPNRRAMHERSADTWETMARAAADTQEKTAINLAAKMGMAVRA